MRTSCSADGRSESADADDGDIEVSQKVVHSPQGVALAIVDTGDVGGGTCRQRVERAEDSKRTAHRDNVRDRHERAVLHDSGCPPLWVDDSRGKRPVKDGADGVGERADRTPVHGAEPNGVAGVRMRVHEEQAGVVRHGLADRRRDPARARAKLTLVLAVPCVIGRKDRVGGEEPTPGDPAPLVEEQEGTALERVSGAEDVDQLVDIDLEKGKAVHGVASFLNRSCMNSKWSSRGLPVGFHAPFRCQENRRHWTPR